MKILIGADLVPTDSNAAFFHKGDAAALVNEDLLRILQSADYRIFNLEVPLTDTATPIGKCGPALIADTATVAGYTALGADLLCLANNHILDQGEQGLFSTMDVLQSNQITYVGAGKDLAEALQPQILQLGEKKIGIYACAEHEFSIAEAGVPGANPFDPLESPDHVAALKAQCDYVVVLYHGGKEHYRYPSPELQRVCRKLVEKGADLVLCQHSHCIGCEEKYQNGTIVYGQGNFLFDRSSSEFWQTSLLVALDEDFQVSYIPLAKQGAAVHLAKEKQGQEILRDFQHRSEEIREAGFIRQKYEKFAHNMLSNYLFSLSGIRLSFFLRALNKLSGHRLIPWLIKKRYPREQLFAIRNFIECEAHREVLLSGLKENKHNAR